VLEAVAALACRIVVGHFSPISYAILSYQPLLKLIFANWFIASGIMLSAYHVRNCRFSERFTLRGWLLICGLTTCVVTLRQISAVYYMNLWQTALAVLPMALVLLLLLHLALTLEPTVVQAAFRWQKLGSKNITLFYLAPNSGDDMRLLLDNCNDVLDRLKMALKIETKLLNIPVFLFNDLATFRGWHKLKVEPYFGMASAGGIHIVNEGWKRLAKSVAHELTHIVSSQCFGKNPVSILDEGLAQYMERELFPGVYLPLTPVLRHHLSELAGQTFIDLRGDPKTSESAYYHARAFGHYLIRSRGIHSVLQTYRIVSNNYVDDGETRLRIAVQEVYNETLEELEDKWRRSCSISDEGELVTPDIYSQTAIEAIRAAEQLALHKGSASVEATHLMGGLLTQKKSILWNVLLFSMVEIPENLLALHSVETNTQTSSGLSVEQKPKWSMSARQAINCAFFEARKFGCTYLGTEHLLLGVLCELEATDAETLASYGITPQEFRDYAIEYYKDHRLRE